MYFSHMLFRVILLLTVGVAQAEEYTFIIPNPIGSSSDIVARTIATEYKLKTGNDLIFDYAPGGDHIIAVNKFKSQAKLSVILGTTTMHVFNHVNKDSIPYNDSDFDHVGWIGWSPHIWYVRDDSPFRNLGDMLKAIENRPVNIGVDGQSTQVNVTSLQNHLTQKNNVNMIIYKGSPMVYTDVLGGHIDIGVGSVTQLLLNSAKENKIRILGKTNNHPMMVNGRRVPVAGDILKANQFDGGFLISITANSTSADAQQLKKDLLEVIRSETVKQSLLQISIDVSGVNGIEATKILKNYREKVKLLK